MPKEEPFPAQVDPNQVERVGKDCLVDVEVVPANDLSSRGVED